jgi:hypothetical protein
MLCRTRSCGFTCASSLEPSPPSCVERVRQGKARHGRGSAINGNDSPPASPRGGRADPWTHAPAFAKTLARLLHPPPSLSCVHSQIVKDAGGTQNSESWMRLEEIAPSRAHRPSPPPPPPNAPPCVFSSSKRYARKPMSSTPATPSPAIAIHTRRRVKGPRFAMG